MNTKDAARFLFCEACVQFMRAKRDEDQDRADLFLNLSLAIEAAYPDAAKEQRK